MFHFAKKNSQRFRRQACIVLLAFSTIGYLAFVTYALVYNPGSAVSVSALAASEKKFETLVSLQDCSANAVKGVSTANGDLLYYEPGHPKYNYVPSEECFISIPAAQADGYRSAWYSSGAFQAVLVRGFFKDNSVSSGVSVVYESSNEDLKQDNVVRKVNLFTPAAASADVEEEQIVPVEDQDLVTEQDPEPEEEEVQTEEPEEKVSDSKPEEEITATPNPQVEPSNTTPAYFSRQQALAQSRDKKIIYVDISEQRLNTMSAGQIQIDTLVTTGKNGFNTPVGYYQILNKATNIRLRPPNIPQFENVEYDLPVDYWLGIGGGYGFHDASWRSVYGAQDYVWGGSHGCINTPYQAVAEMYGWAEVGTTVYIVP